MAEPPQRNSKTDRGERPSHVGPLWRRSDQLAAATLTLLGLVGMAAYWFAQGGAQGRLLDVDHAPRRDYAFQVDVNSAEWPELAQLPGVGITLAQRIVERRKTVGPFLNHDDLLEVRGIGPRTLEGIRPYLLPLVDPSNVAIHDQVKRPVKTVP
ncbi:MAG: helix-hairpin-helix domain-containing protein [Pirellulales bacterium]